MSGTPCPNAVQSGRSILWSPVKVDASASTWRFFSALANGTLDYAGARAVFRPYTGAATQHWRLVPPPPPAGPLALWTPPIPLPILAIAGYNAPDGRVLLWTSSQRDSFATGELRTFSALLDPATGDVSATLLTSLQADMFCPGTAMLADGRLLVAGGVTSGATNLCNGTAWARSARLAVRRGYNAAVALPDGGAFTLGGSWSGGVGGKIGEAFNGTAWRPLPGVPSDPFLTRDAAGAYRSDNHMWLFAAGGGWVFHAGPSRAMHWVDTAGPGAVRPAGNRSDDSDAMNGVACVFDVGMILTAGGAGSYQGAVPSDRAYVIDISAGPGAPARVSRTGPLNAPRAFHNAVVLPTGDVVVVGGQSGPTTLFVDSQAALSAEIWRPSTGRFELLAWGPGGTPFVTPRVYHSIALLLADGRVLSSGGGGCGPTCLNNHLDAQARAGPRHRRRGALVRPSVALIPALPLSLPPTPPYLPLRLSLSRAPLPSSLLPPPSLLP